MDDSLQQPSDKSVLEQELEVHKEWDNIQQNLFNLARIIQSEHLIIQPLRTFISEQVIQITRSRARIWWKPDNQGTTDIASHLLEIRMHQICYGMLELTPGYLVSYLSPAIPQHFANHCACLVALAEQQVFSQYQLEQFSCPFIHHSRLELMLTKREKDVLMGLIRRESEPEMAKRLGIVQTTVNTHIQRLYRRLHVNKSQDAILLAFKLKLVNWLDLS